MPDAASELLEPSSSGVCPLRGAHTSPSAPSGAFLPLWAGLGWRVGTPAQLAGLVAGGCRVLEGRPPLSGARREGLHREGGAGKVVRQRGGQGYWLFPVCKGDGGQASLTGFVRM